MRVAIITIYPHANYGGLLQAYALSLVIKRLGHNPTHIFLSTKERYNYKTPLRILKNLWRKFVKGEKVIIFRERKYNREYPIVSQFTQTFMDKYIPYVELKRYTDLKCDDWDVLITGSDQVWRPKYLWEKLPHFFFLFAKSWSIRRISYAASFGIDGWEFERKQEKQCKDLIKLFDYISVREESGVELCRKHFKVNAKVVLDPTLLLLKEDYERIVLDSNVSPSPGNLLCYILDENEEKQQVILEMSHKYNLNPFRVNSRYEDPFAPLEERIQPPVEKWLRGFMDAKFVVTDSFHACVFSVIFKKPFIVIGNKSRGMTRFTSLLSQIGLEDRLITDASSIPQNISDIDWNNVEKRLDVQKKMSIEYLNTALSLSK